MEKQRESALWVNQFHLLLFTIFMHDQQTKVLFSNIKLSWLASHKYWTRQSTEAISVRRIKPPEEHWRFVPTRKLLFPWVSAESTEAGSGSTIPSSFDNIWYPEQGYPLKLPDTITWGHIRIPITRGSGCYGLWNCDKFALFY